MNKIYRVVWNSSLNLWVAVGEYTRSKSKGQGKSRTKIIRNSILTSVLTLLLLPTKEVSAAIVDYDNVYLIAIGAGSISRFPIVADGFSHGNTNMIGKTVYSVAVGHGALAQYGGVAFGDHASSGALFSTALGSYSSANYMGSTAIGTAALASGRDSTAIGYVANAKSLQDVAIGTAAVAGYQVGGNSSGEIPSDNSNVGDNTAIGYNARAIGGSSLAQGTHTKASGVSSTALGAYATAEANYAFAAGAKSSATAESAMAIGTGASATHANSIALGSNAKTTNTVNTTSAIIAGDTYTFAGTSPIGSVSLGTAGAERTITNLAAGRISDTSTDAINGSQLNATNKALNSINTDVTQLQQDALLWDPTLNAYSASHNSTTVNKITNVADGALTDTSTDAVNGSQLKQTNDQVATNTTNITKNANDIKNLDNSVTNIYNTGTKYFHANSTGADSQALGADSVAIGMSAVSNGDSAVAIGMGANATSKNSVALGADSSATAAVGTKDVIINGKTYYFAGSSPVGTVSIGDAGAERTLTNLAAGRLSATSTDAVNGSQLYATNLAVNNINTDISTLKQDALLWDPTLNAYSASHNSTTVNKITNVADGALTDTSTDAVNGSQLKKTNDQVATNTTNITNNANDIKNLDNSVTNIYNSGTKYFHANSTGADSQALGADSVAIGMSAVALGENAIAIGMGASATSKNSVALGANAVATTAIATEKVMINGVEYYFAGNAPIGTVSIGDVGSERTLTNLAAGRLSTTSTDAVNGSQLYATNQALNNINVDVTALQQDALLWDPTLNAFSASHGSVTINKITNVAAGELSQTSTDAVNGSQLYATNQKVENIDGRLINVENTVYNSIIPTMRYLKVNSTGADAIATGSDAIALGQGTVASGDNSISVGNGAKSAGEYATAIGSGSSATGQGSTALGSNASATGQGSVAIGEGSSAEAKNSVALGSGSIANRENTVSVGSEGNERQITNVAAGTQDTDAVNVAQLKEVAGDVTNISNNVTNITEGKDGMFQVNNTDNYAKPSPTGSNSIAGGAGASASGNNSMSIGTNSSSSGNNSVSLGNGSSATASNAVALGANSIADRANSVSVGSSGSERQITNVAAGTADTDAVNLSQLKQSASSSNQYTNQKFNYLNNKLNEQKNKLSAGIAGAMAMSGLPQPYSPGASMVGLAGGTYQGESAVALGISTISDNGKWVTKLSGTTNSQGDLGAAVGIGYQW